MEHLPSNASTMQRDQATIRVAYTCEEVYNSTPFDFNAIWQGFELARLMNGQVEGKNIDEVGLFLQALLYLGLLSELLRSVNMFFDPQDFIENDNKRLVF